jgi:hypothetical protein
MDFYKDKIFNRVYDLKNMNIDKYRFLFMGGSVHKLIKG